MSRKALVSVWLGASDVQSELQVRMCGDSIHVQHIHGRWDRRGLRYITGEKKAKMHNKSQKECFLIRILFAKDTEQMAKTV